MQSYSRSANREKMTKGLGPSSNTCASVGLGCGLISFFCLQTSFGDYPDQFGEDLEEHVTNTDYGAQFVWTGRSSETELNKLSGESSGAG